MTITFHGAARNVTGSKHLIQLDNGIRILLDCGMFQGMGEQTEALNEHFGFKPDSVDYMILSHAHIDHCGLIPRLVAEGFNGTIFCTPATFDLVKILLADSARIQEQDSSYSNKHREKHHLPLLAPLYTEEHATESLRLFKTVEYNSEHPITNDVTFHFTDAGHLIGSAAVHLSINENGKETKITFSGDVGRYGDLLLKSPQPFPQADYILLESTYGDSLHKDVGAIDERLLEVILQTCINKKGKVIIPAFSVGRTQEILYALNALELKGRLPQLPYYVDSPLSEKATQVMMSHPEVYNKAVSEVLKIDANPFGFKGLKFIESTDESKALNDDPSPCVIISSSGMAEAGRKFAVKASVESIRSMSAHGDYDDLLHFISGQDPQQVKTIFLVHGDYEVQQHFKQKLKEKGFGDIEIPYQHQKITL
eukprot:gene17240-17430_t